MITVSEKNRIMKALKGLEDLKKKMSEALPAASRMADLEMKNLELEQEVEELKGRLESLEKVNASIVKQVRAVIQKNEVARVFKRFETDAQDQKES